MPLAMAHGGFQGGAPGEYEVKAAFIYNFSKFIDWPVSTSGEMRLCILGADPFGNALAAVENKVVGSRRFTSRHIGLQTDGELSGCDILFIARSEHERLPGLLKVVKGLPVLTVGDTAGFARQGVMVNFYLDQDKVRFEFNHDAATRAGLRLSAKLLQLGRIVGSQD